MVMVGSRLVVVVVLQLNLNLYFMEICAVFIFFSSFVINNGHLFHETNSCKLKILFVEVSLMHN